MIIFINVLSSYNVSLKQCIFKKNSLVDTYRERNLRNSDPIVVIYGPDHRLRFLVFFFTVDVQVRQLETVLKRFYFDDFIL